MDPAATCCPLLSLIASFLLASPIAAFLFRRPPERRYSSARWPCPRHLLRVYSEQRSLAGRSYQYKLISPFLLSCNSCKLSFGDSRPRAKVSITCPGQPVAGRCRGLGPPSGAQTQKMPSFLRTKKVPPGTTKPGQSSAASSEGGKWRRYGEPQRSPST